MKMPEEIKKGLECISVEHQGCAECPYRFSGDCDGAVTADALAYIHQLEKMLGESFARNAPALEAAYGLAEKVRQLEAQAPKWISVEERLPDNDRDILVAIYGKRVQLGYYADDVEAFVVNGEVACGEEVTHWMPLPEPAEV